MFKKIIYLAAIFIIYYSFFNTHTYAQWVQQNMPVSGTPYDMVFFDASTGIISLNSIHVLRTTNAGMNWSVSARIVLFKMDKIDSTAVYGNGRTVNGYEVIYKTTNRGLTWDSVAIFLENFYGGISFINRDTGWVAGIEGDSLTIWRTTNGGVTIISQTRNIGRDRIFFLKKPINGQYYGWVTFGPQMWRTTNSGLNWSPTASSGNLLDIQFINKDTGWTVNGGQDVPKTTNGGLNWIYQSMPTGNGITLAFLEDLKIINKDTLYGVGGVRFFGMGQFRGIIWKSTNGGQLWGFQQPDTSFNISKFYVTDFIENQKGWAYGINSGVYTNIGGGPITNITNEITSVNADNYKLKQNYPNPFNPETVIEFSIKQSSTVNLIIYDVLGKEVLSIYKNERLNSGSYKSKINLLNKNISTGVYFYNLSLTEKNTNKSFNETKK